MFGDANIAIFAGRGGKAFAERMCSYMGRPLGESEVIRFSEGTSFVRFQKSVRDRDVYLVQPMALSPNDQFVEMLFWLDAFKRSSAASVTTGSSRSFHHSPGSPDTMRPRRSANSRM